MNERWRRPLAVTAVEPDPAGTFTAGDRVYSNADVTLADEGEYQRLREGYVCANCLEPHEIPFPTACTLCGFPMQDEQSERLQQAFKGEKWVGPRTSNSDEFQRLDELNARAARSGIVLPYGGRGR